MDGDNMSLAELEMLSFSNATSCGALLDKQYWDTVLTTSGNATSHLIQNTVYSLQQSTDQWTVFLEKNMSNPPWWLPMGPSNYTLSLEAQLEGKIMGPTT